MEEAKKTAGVKCRWHDLQTHAVSRVAAGGATDGTLQAIFGWMSPEMIGRYSAREERGEADRRFPSWMDPGPGSGPHKNPHRGCGTHRSILT